MSHLLIRDPDTDETILRQRDATIQSKPVPANPIAIQFEAPDTGSETFEYKTMYKIGETNDDA